MEFANKNSLAGEDEYFLDVRERIYQSDSVRAELPELVAKIYECFVP